MTSVPRFGLADFKMLDAIEEFGEKRFIKLKPTRLKAGPVKIHPTLRTSVEYDSNILLEPSDARGDVIYHIQPGIVLELPVDTHQLTVGYEADMEFFSKSRHSNQNDQNQNFFALLDLKFPSWYINVLEKLSETSGRSGTTFTSRIPRIDQSVHPKIGYRWKRFVFEAAYRHFLRDFRRQADDALDFQLNEWTGVLYYDLFARLKALLEYQVAQIDYDDDFSRNGTFHQVRVGFDGEPMPNLRMKVRIGAQFRDYEEDPENDFNSWVGEIWAEYKVRNDIKLVAEVSREPVEATFGSVNYYTEHRMRGGVEYSPWQKWTLFSDFSYFRHDYAERATLGTRTGYRRDDHLQSRTGLRYLPNEWLQVEMAYEYLRRDSNFSTLDYTDHRFSAASTLSY